MMTKIVTHEEDLSFVIAGLVAGNRVQTGAEECHDLPSVG